MLDKEGIGKSESLELKNCEQVSIPYQAHNQMYM
jgi:hypothetical protein